MRYLFLALLICILSCKAEQPVKKCCPSGCQVLAVVSGTVQSVGDVWTMNGDGYLTLVTANGRIVQVSIRGWPSDDYTPTRIELKTVKYVSQLAGKKIQVRGTYQGTSISADIINEF